MTDARRVGAGAVVTGALGAPLVVATAAPSSLPALLSWSSLGVAAAVVVPIYVYQAYRFNISGRKAVESAFKQHRLALPAIIAPGHKSDGSFYFPVTPSPLRLEVRCRIADQLQDVSLPLHALAKLHLTQEPIPAQLTRPAAGTPENAPKLAPGSS